MANAVYPIGATSIGSGSIDFSMDTFRCVLVDTDTYTYSAAHDFHADLSGITATSGDLTVSITSGVVDITDFAFSSVSGNESEALIFYKWSGSSATSPLLFYFDTGVTNLPVTPNGTDINVVLNGSGVYSLVG